MKKQYMFSNLIGFLETKVINETATPEKKTFIKTICGTEQLIKKVIHTEI